MSYKRPNTGNSMNDYFSALMDFVSISPRLLEARDDFEFELWFDKLRLIDNRALYLFLHENKDQIPRQRIRYAQHFFKREI